MRSTPHPQLSNPYPTPSPAGAITATEQRAFNNLGITRLFGAPIGLTGFGPNINLARDPRFGRVSELPGEDPVLSGAYAAEMVRGMQGGTPFRARSNHLSIALGTNPLNSGIPFP